MRCSSLVGTCLLVALVSGDSNPPSGQKKAIEDIALKIGHTLKGSISTEVAKAGFVREDANAVKDIVVKATSSTSKEEAQQLVKEFTKSHPFIKIANITSFAQNHPNLVSAWVKSQGPKFWSESN